MLTHKRNATQKWYVIAVLLLFGCANSSGSKHSSDAEGYSEDKASGNGTCGSADTCSESAFCSSADLGCVPGAPYTKFAELDSVFVGEEKVGTFMCKSRDFPVKYLTSVERQQFKVEVRCGLVYDSRGKLFSSDPEDETLFVMAGSGEIYMKPNWTPCLFHHSSFLAGQPVASAGVVEVTNGVIESLTSESGHYKPNAAQMQQVLREIAWNGVDIGTIDLDFGYGD